MSSYTSSAAQAGPSVAITRPVFKATLIPLPEKVKRARNSIGDLLNESKYASLHYQQGDSRCIFAYFWKAVKAALLQQLKDDNKDISTTTWRSVNDFEKVAVKQRVIADFPDLLGFENCWPVDLAASIQITHIRNDLQREERKKRRLRELQGSRERGEIENEEDDETNSSEVDELDESGVHGEKRGHDGISDRSNSAIEDDALALKRVKPSSTGTPRTLIASNKAAATSKPFSSKPNSSKSLSAKTPPSLPKPLLHSALITPKPTPNFRSQYPHITTTGRLNRSDCIRIECGNRQDQLSEDGNTWGRLCSYCVREQQFEASWDQGERLLARDKEERWLREEAGEGKTLVQRAARLRTEGYAHEQLVDQQHRDWRGRPARLDQNERRVSEEEEELARVTEAEDELELDEVKDEEVVEIDEEPVPAPTPKAKKPKKAIAVPVAGKRTGRVTRPSLRLGDSVSQQEEVIEKKGKKVSGKAKKATVKLSATALAKQMRQSRR